MKTVKTKMWAPIVKSKRGSDWIVWTCIRSTRKQALHAYLSGLNPAPEIVKAHLDRVRFARVSVIEEVEA